MLTGINLVNKKTRKRLVMGNKGFCDFAVWVAESPAELKDEVIDGVEKFLKQNMTSV